MFNFISIGVAGILFVIGVGYTVILFSTDYSVQKGETGVNFQIDKVVDITTSEFFGKFSLLILTGLTIGGISLWWGLIIYTLFFAVIGIMYIRFEMLYFNPLLIIFGFHIYRAEGFVEDTYKNYYFISKEKKSIWIAYRSCKLLCAQNAGYPFVSQWNHSNERIKTCCNYRLK